MDNADRPASLDRTKSAAPGTLPRAISANVGELIERLRLLGPGGQLSVPLGDGFAEVTRAGSRYLSFVPISTTVRGIFAWMEEIARCGLPDVHVVKHRDKTYLCQIGTVPDLMAFCTVLETLQVIEKHVAPEMRGVVAAGGARP